MHISTVSIVRPAISYQCLAPPSEAVAKVAPKPMVSTADDGTITIEPRSLIASYSMFIARKQGDRVVLISQCRLRELLGNICFRLAGNDARLTLTLRLGLA